MRREGVLVSAHRCLTHDDLRRALALEVDFVEFDVQRCRDGLLVVHHDPVFAADCGDVAFRELTGAEVLERLPGLLTYEGALAALAGRRGAHIDLKASAAGTECAVGAVARAVEVLGPDGFVVTTGSDRAVKAIRDWGDQHGVRVLAGLSLGRNTRGFSLREQVRIRRSELLPGRRVRLSRASVIVAHHSLALLGVARFARRHHLPLLVWTVDTERSLRHWLRPGRAWMVTTNDPGLALRTRAAERIRP
ncbi:MAG: cytoplasmic glycerophosphodiester phosphodiesterase [Nocardioides sp.]|nr:cytoplasmic glycerophosphodiester phosphodiesterase [Nocardioides sp.]